MYTLKIMFMSGSEDGLELLLTSERYGQPFENGWTFKIGRCDECDVKIAYDVQVSREHAFLYLLPDGLWLKDAGSRNGCLVRDERVAGQVQIEVRELFRVGLTWLRVQEYGI